MTASLIPPLFRGLLDDAAVFPPGSLPLADAVPAHSRHLAAAYRELVGPLVLPASALPGLEIGAVDVSVTLPDGPAGLPGVLEAMASSPARLAGLEIPVPAGMGVPEFFTALEAAPAPVFVEVPRDERRAGTLAACAETGHRAKFRTGGVRAELYPDETELAAAILAAVRAEVSFKATAGLHHAVRNTDPVTGFEQHGYLNLLLATAVAAGGAAEPEVVAALAERDRAEVARRVSTVEEEVRGRFLSFGTCDILEPLTELVELDLVAAGALGGDGAKA
ncbi:hypothetical protein FNH05_34000 [Amycolatopsis rhizosphaerae]|uniref:Uncharacterized protein n=1 Tax=Amycolatopsis rhizosphaerae TaxID=2053003 RepID=A0A558AAX2_9PSEU|nr:hypothetical protein FNH05_34000 [Amycolatopsis rhizosphaerae]